MKLIFAIVSRQDTNTVCDALIDRGYYVTKLATTGGFLKVGNTTLLIGVDETQVDDVLKIIEDHSKTRKEIVPLISPSEIGIYSSQTMEVTVGGATIFVVDAEQLVKI
ncbi:MAG: cyclic-di-AMP receptor [Bacilli bacterium]|nr:cyclic-di-AMP receptor [Bacilli bacterium]